MVQITLGVSLTINILSISLKQSVKKKESSTHVIVSVHFISTPYNLSGSLEVKIS